jgi:hypothetical protein
LAQNGQSNYATLRDSRQDGNCDRRQLRLVRPDGKETRDAGADRASAIYPIIETTKFNGGDLGGRAGPGNLDSGIGGLSA